MLCTRVLIGSNSSLDVLVTYTNVGMEDAVDLVLQYQLPDIFSDISSVGVSSSSTCNNVQTCFWCHVTTAPPLAAVM